MSLARRQVNKYLSEKYIGLCNRFEKRTNIKKKKICLSSQDERKEVREFI